MLKLKFEEMYADMWVGSIIWERKSSKKLATVCVDRKRPFTFLGNPIKMDGVHPLKYDHFNDDGYHFRPLMNRRTIETRMIDGENPVYSRREVLYIVAKKRKWEEVCKKLFIAGEKEICIEGYDERDQLPSHEERFLGYEEEDDDDWEEE